MRSHFLTSVANQSKSNWACCLPLRWTDFKESVQECHQMHHELFIERESANWSALSTNIYHQQVSLLTILDKVILLSARNSFFSHFCHPLTYEAAAFQNYSGYTALDDIIVDDGSQSLSLTSSAGSIKVTRQSDLFRGFDEFVVLFCSIYFTLIIYICSSERRKFGSRSIIKRTDEDASNIDRQRSARDAQLSISLLWTYLQWRWQIIALSTTNLRDMSALSTIAVFTSHQRTSTIDAIIIRCTCQSIERISLSINSHASSSNRWSSTRRRLPWEV